MTDTAQPSVTRTLDARGSFCPGPLMELIRAIREGQVSDVIAIWSADRGSRIDIPKWVEGAGGTTKGRCSGRCARSGPERRGRADAAVSRGRPPGPVGLCPDRLAPCLNGPAGPQ